MKKLMAMIAMVLVSTASTQSWALVGLEGLSWDGSLEVSGHAANNEDDENDDASDRRGGTNTRVRVGVNATVTEDVTGRVEFTRTGRQYGTGATTINSEESMINVQNAFVDFDKVFGFTARLGRQYVGNPGDLVWRVGPFSDDSLSVNALDGVLVGRKWDFIGFDAITGKANEDDGLAETNADNVATTGDTNLSAIHAWLPTIIPGGNIWAGYLWGVDENDMTQGSTKLTIARIGANGSVNENMFTWRAEGLKNMGEDNIGATTTDFNGHAIDLGVGFNLPENGFGGIGLIANYLMASGDDDATDNDEDTFRDFSRLGINTSDRYYGEIFGRSNTASNGGRPRGQGANLNTGAGSGAQYLHLGLVLKPKFLEAKTWWRVDFFNLGAAEDEDYGRELDFTAGYKHSDNVGFEAGWAMFSPDDGVVGTTAGTPDDDVTKLFGRVKVAWGGGMQKID